MASHPPGQCCTIGVKHEGEAQGKMQTIVGTETYIATPSKPHSGKAILLCTDAMGHRMINSQLIADQFAANGYLCYMPDLFEGNPAPLNRPADFDITAWRQGHSVKAVDPIVQAAVKHLRENEGITRLGAVGYCFGAKYVARQMDQAIAEKGVDVGYVAHPSYVDEEELEKINGPLSISAAETDQIFPEEKRYKSEEILKKKSGNPYQINLFSGVVHGFAVRGDLSKPEAKFAKEQAFYQAIQWFDQWL